MLWDELSTTNHQLVCKLRGHVVGGHHIDFTTCEIDEVSHSERIRREQLDNEDVARPNCFFLWALPKGGHFTNHVSDFLHWFRLSMLCRQCRTNRDLLALYSSRRTVAGMPLLSGAKGASFSV
jgi:hypothetical protein